MRALIRLWCIPISIYLFFYSLVTLYPGDIYTYLIFGLLINIIGLLFLKEWARIFTIIIMLLMGARLIYLNNVIGSDKEVNSFAARAIAIITLFIVGFFFIPKVKEQFK